MQEVREVRDILRNQVTSYCVTGKCAKAFNEKISKIVQEDTDNIIDIIMEETYFVTETEIEDAIRIFILRG